MNKPNLLLGMGDLFEDKKFPSHTFMVKCTTCEASVITDDPKTIEFFIDHHDAENHPEVLEKLDPMRFLYFAKLYGSKDEKETIL